MINELENPWTILHSKEVYDNKWIQVKEHQVLNPGGGEGIYGTVHFKNLAIGIVVLDDFKNIWLVGQYRFPIETYSWEIPEGGSGNGDPLEAAKRELLEETGIKANSWLEIQRIHLSNSVSDEIGIIFLAQDIEIGQSEPEETEELQVRKLPFSEAFEMVIRGEITDSLSVAGIFKIRLLNLA